MNRINGFEFGASKPKKHKVRPQLISTRTKVTPSGIEILVSEVMSTAPKSRTFNLPLDSPEALELPGLSRKSKIIIHGLCRIQGIKSVTVSKHGLKLKLQGKCKWEDVSKEVLVILNHALCYQADGLRS